MVDAAMYDAVNGIAGRAQNREPAIVAPERGTSGDPMVAAAAAAHDVLASLYPARSGDYNERLDADIDRSTSAALAEKGRTWGERVAE